MKSNIIKYIFILFVIGMIGLAIYKIYYKEDSIPKNELYNEPITQAEILTNIRLRNCEF